MMNDTSNPTTPTGDEESRPTGSEEIGVVGDVGVADQYKALEAERDKYLELARRTQAEFENYQKRVRRDMDAERRYAATAGDLGSPTGTRQPRTRDTVRHDRPLHDKARRRDQARAQAMD